jgi:hypothetical protein
MRTSIFFQGIFCLLFLAGLAGCQTTPSARQTQAIEEMDRILNQGMAEARRKSMATPHGAAAAILDRLEKTKRYVDEVEKGERNFDLEEMLALTRKSQALVASLQSEFQLALNADVAFRLGGYQPSDLLAGGQAILDEFAASILEAQLPEYQQKFPGVPLVVTLSTTGYADAVRPAAPLVRDLLRTHPKPAPADPVAKRRFLNRLLSIRRSRTINRHLQNRLREPLREAGVALGPPSIEGRGEAFPAPPDTVTPPYRDRDDRRRICKIYSNILIQ